MKANRGKRMVALLGHAVTTDGRYQIALKMDGHVYIASNDGNGNIQVIADGKVPRRNGVRIAQIAEYIAEHLATAMAAITENIQSQE